MNEKLYRGCLIRQTTPEHWVVMVGNRTWTARSFDEARAWVDQKIEHALSDALGTYYDVRNYRWMWEDVDLSAFTPAQAEQLIREQAEIVFDIGPWLNRLREFAGEDSDTVLAEITFEQFLEANTEHIHRAIHQLQDILRRTE